MSANARSFNCSKYHHRPINQLSFVSFRVDVNDSPNKGNWSFARLLRERNFGGVSTGLFDPLDVTMCHHVLTFVGDAPVAAARWAFTDDNGVEIALVEKLGVIDMRRNRTYGTYTLGRIIEDVKAKMAAEGRHVYAIVASVVHDPMHPAWKTFVKCGFKPMGQSFPVDNKAHVKMVLRHS
ncbi:Aste57867_18715 [Aphanomyces stellatus]|uniref:Aste57867_18715 protein n=1 Tax=Aphanomyces stellatus TaxID=120398 RepID=A0A485LBE2_9STRA|nr:hypothetical protein As57867_018651 [Aphanomyces stellatus]VFT95449.1 Aste57867_18715 [Aphanomyces stellatus]